MLDATNAVSTHLHMHVFSLQCYMSNRGYSFVYELLATVGSHVPNPLPYLYMYDVTVSMLGYLTLLLL